MPEKIQLFITDPCHEQWGDMQPNAEGRFCSSCKKTVVDFSMMSDQEVLSWLSGAGRSVCGRFTNDQLNRDLTPAKVSGRRRWVLWWQLLLAGWLVSSEASAQTGTPAGPRIEHIDPGQKKNIFMPQEAATLRGTLGAVSFRETRGLNDVLRVRVMDAVSTEPIPWASVRRVRGAVQRMTDSAGWFSLSRKEIKKIRQVEISAAGYAPTLFDITNVGKDEYVRILRLNRAEGELPVVTVVGYGWTKGKVDITCTKTTVVQDIVRDSLAFLGLIRQPFGVYPNPVARGASVTLSLKRPVPGNYLVQLFNTAGSLVESMHIEGVKESRTELLNIPGTVAAGVYFLRLQHEQTGKVYTQKMEVL